ncbi:MAG: ABC transporter ATP-binding protein [Pseudomonadales bacterium]|nr:ABC transporter ATP-binding protein [Pseudomonadales bacterium]
MIEVNNLGYRYPGEEKETLKELSFEIEKAEIFGFLGPSGSGKSTTQKLLIGLLENYSGSARAMDKEVSVWGHEYYRHIGVGFELPNHFSKLSGQENLKLFESFYGGTPAGGRSITELLALVNLTDAAARPVAQYSKGMKMRLNFARALLNNPDILFLDEPTAGLDPVTARQLKNTILELKGEGKTIFLTTHNMHDADELCDRVGFIVDGELSLIGEPKVLKREQGSQLVTVQVREENGGIAEHHFPLDSLHQNREFLDLLAQKDIESLHSQESSLEEVFIAATGKTLQ